MCFIAKLYNFTEEHKLTDYDFQSAFAMQLRSFIAQKKALGFLYDKQTKTLMDFEKMCLLVKPRPTVLTREVCYPWTLKRPTENNTSFRNRLSPIREFAKFIIRNGGDAYIIPINVVKKSPRHQPYIYSKDEVAYIWEEFDKIKSTKAYPAKQAVMSAIVRVLYCLGLRPCEVRRLKCEDVDLTIGKFFIRESKGHKDRIVMIADDLTKYLALYNEEVNNCFPNREWFFPNVRGNFCPQSWLNDNFMHICQKLKICTIDGKPPRMYDLRHTMATHRLYEWMKSGINIYEEIQYLSRYLGHAQLSDTYYYIHFVPEQIQTLAGIDISRYENLLPEVKFNDD
jgi:integrase